MARTIDLRDDKARARAGLVSETVPSPYRKSYKTVAQEKRAVEDTRRMIIELVYDSSQPLTRLQICRLLDRAKTPHLVAIIEQLAGEGVIGRGCSMSANGIITYWYVGLE